ncbi:MAG TPA: ECF transporter S component, partial [Clostridiales bacterium UBA8960]|nr:ECF transporter S component [Clostridiales bacterium UBA8960]
LYTRLYELPMDVLVSFGTAVNANITSLSTFILYAIIPFNLLKGVTVSILTILLYKRISPILHKGI